MKIIISIQYLSYSLFLVKQSSIGNEQNIRKKFLEKNWWL